MQCARGNLKNVKGHLVVTHGVSSNVTLNCSMILKTVLFYCRYVELGSVIYEALIDPPSRRNGRFSKDSPIRKPAKMIENNKQGFPLFSFLSITTFRCVQVFCPLGRMESPCIAFHARGKTSSTPKRTAKC